MKIRKITESQLRFLVKKMVNEQAYMAPGMMSPGDDAENCDQCGQPVDPSDVSPAGLCPDCEMQNIMDDEYGEEGLEGSECPECGAEMDPNQIEDNPGGLCDNCAQAWEEGEAAAAGTMYEEGTEPCSECGKMTPLSELGAGYCSECLARDY